MVVVVDLEVVVDLTVVVVDLVVLVDFDTRPREREVALQLMGE